MAERAWSIAPISKPAATSFEKFAGEPGENGRRWLRRFLFHYDNATPTQLMSLIDIHLVGKAVEWADGNKEVATLLAAKDASNATVTQFQELFNKRFDLSTAPRAPRATVFRESSSERLSARSSDVQTNTAPLQQRMTTTATQEQTTTTTAQQQDTTIPFQQQIITEPVGLQPVLKQDRPLWNQFSPEEVEYYRRQAIEETIPSRRNDLPRPTVTLLKHPSGIVGTAKRGRSPAVEAESQVIKRPRVDTETAVASASCADEQVHLATNPTFDWQQLYQSDEETVQEYGARTLDLFNATGGLDRVFRKQKLSEIEANHLTLVVKSFCEGLRDHSVRNRMSKFNKANSSLERMCRSAHEFALVEAEGECLTDKQAFSRVRQAVNDRMNPSVRRAIRIDEKKKIEEKGNDNEEKDNKKGRKRKKEKKTHKESQEVTYQNNQALQLRPPKTSAKASKITDSNPVVQSLQPVNSSLFKHVDHRVRESVHIKKEDSDSSVVSDTSEDSD